jgi:flagellin-like protein
MNIQNLISDDDAVSPVIGVILMVAITVILAAVIGTFVLGLGGSVQQTAPQASFTFDYTENSGGNDDLIITHDGGDSIEPARLNTTQSGATATVSGGSLRLADNPWAGGGTVEAGTSVEFDETEFSATAGNSVSGDLDLSGATIRVVWNSQNGENTATLAKFSGPDA